MSTIVLDCFPEGRRKALIMSYDDGVIQDRRLVEIFNRHGIRGTFHLNSGHFDTPGKLSASEIKSLFAGHEVSVHTVTHPHLPHLPNEGIIREIMEDRRALEALVGYPVRGMSYPGGGYDDRVVALLPSLGIEYARTCLNQESFLLPDDFLRWPASCHHRRAMERAAQFKAVPAGWGMQVFYVWGHSYEFDHQDNWDMIEKFCATMAHDPGVWYCTQIEMVDYVQAARRLRSSADGSIVHNPNAIPIWATMDGKAIRIEPGQTVKVG